MATKPAATVAFLFCNFNIQTYRILVTTVAISPKNMMLSHNVTRASICYDRLSTKMVKFNFERTIPLKIKPPQYNFLNKTHQISANCIYKHRKVFQSILRSINVASERPK